MKNDMPGKAVVFLLVASLFSCARAREVKPLQTVKNVDVSRYLGKWYEIAKYPNSFQKNCVAATATYSLRPDNKITVWNECRRGGLDGKVKSVRGKAWIVDRASNAKLKVQFFWPFSGDYWIIQLGDDYEYAVVGEPKRRYLWILCRQPFMDEALYRKILERLAEQGYDPGRLDKSPQKR